MTKPVVLSLAALASVAVLVGRDGADVAINGQKGVLLSGIEIVGPPPTEIVIGAAGTIKAPALASEADITIGGSGDIAFASDGTAEANIGGAGDVRGAANAKCTINPSGSGTLTCTPTAHMTAALPAPAAIPAE